MMPVFLAALLLCLPGFVMTLIHVRRDGLARVLPHGWIISESVVVLLVVLSLMTKSPASPGQGLWLPLLVGAIFGRVITKLALNLKSHSVATSMMLGLPVVALSAFCLPHAAYPTPAVLGVSLGALICMVPIGLHTSPESWERRRIEIAALSLVLSAVGILYGMSVHPRLVAGDNNAIYWGWPMMLIAVGSLSMLFSERVSWMIVWSFVLTTAATVAFCKYVGNWQSLSIGLATTVLPLVLYAWILEAQKALSPRPLRMDTPALMAGMLALALAALGFREAKGYSEVMAAIPLLVVASPLLTRHLPGAALVQRLLHSTMLVVAAVAVIRLPQQLIGYADKLNLQYFYDLISLLIGAFLITSMPAIDLEQWAESAFTSLVTVIIYLGAPLVLFIVWGDRSLHAMLTGLVVGMSFRAMKLESLGTCVAVLLAMFSAAIFIPPIQDVVIPLVGQVGIVVVLVLCLFYALWRSLRSAGASSEEAPQ